MRFFDSELSWTLGWTLLAFACGFLSGLYRIRVKLHRVVEDLSRLLPVALLPRSKRSGFASPSSDLVALESVARIFKSERQSEFERRRALEAEVRRLTDARSGEAASLSKMTQLLHACRTAEEIFQVAAHLLAEVFNRDSGSIYATAGSQGLLHLAATFGDSKSASIVELPCEACWAVRHGKPHVTPAGSSGPKCHHLTNIDENSICLPIVQGHLVLGLLHVSGQDGLDNGRWIESRLRVATPVVESCSLALTNLRLRETLQDQSMRDPLTGLKNRRYLEQTLSSKQFRRLHRRAGIGLLMIDIDHFKTFNDAYGHAVGDAVLIAVAKRLARCVRGHDLVCRYGGEEFVVVLPGLSLERVKRRAEEMVRRIRRLHVRHRGESYGPVTISCGVASYPEHGRAPASLMHEADKALYRAKERGRNRVVVAAEIDEPRGRLRALPSGDADPAIESVRTADSP